MITEDYISFETAKLLKEKGFNELTSLSYSLPYGYESHIPCSNGVDTDFVSRITLQMAMKWLREVHNLFIFPFPQRNTNKFWTEIFQLSDNQEWENLYCESIDLQDYQTYEEACEAAIKYCLENLI